MNTIKTLYIWMALQWHGSIQITHRFGRHTWRIRSDGRAVRIHRIGNQTTTDRLAGSWAAARDLYQAVPYLAYRTQLETQSQD